MTFDPLFKNWLGQIFLFTIRIYFVTTSPFKKDVVYYSLFTKEKSFLLLLIANININPN